MPWHQEAMKDVISCDKPRVEAHILLSGDFRMGKPTSMEVCVGEFIAGTGRRGELKHLSTLRKRNQRDSLSSGERKGRSLNSYTFLYGGLWDSDMVLDNLVEQSGKTGQRR